MKFPSWPKYDASQIAAVTRVLKSGKANQWTGSEVFEFEKEYADYVGVKYAVALANGSIALDAALTVLGIGAGDEVIVTCRSFVASASCIVLIGATVVFADVNQESQNITVETIQRLVTNKTKAIIAVHLAGWPCEMDKLSAFCREHKLFLIEDCAQAHGAKYKNKPVGSFGDFGCFSFCQDKIITTAGEGGMLVTNNTRLWNKAWSLKDHGRDFETMFNKNKTKGFEWAVKSFGTNYRLTELQAAIGRIQLARLDSWVKKRRQLADILTEGFSAYSQLRVTMPPDNTYHSYYKYYVFLRPQLLKPEWTKQRFIKEFEIRSIPCRVGACPEIYKEEAFRNLYMRRCGCEHPVLPIACQLGQTCLMFQVHPALTHKHMRIIISTMGDILQQAAI